MLGRNHIAIEVVSLVKEYGDLTAVNSISFTIEKGKIFSLLGPNGAGKTTTVEILECLRKPTNGHGYVLGFDISKNQDEIKKLLYEKGKQYGKFRKITRN